MKLIDTLKKVMEATELIIKTKKEKPQKPKSSSL